jgi:toxin ParE1/3/4
MKLVWSPESGTDRLSIFKHIAADNPAAAFDMETLFEDRAEQLLDFPDKGRPGALADTRELTVHPNYRLIYEVVEDTVRILNVVHARRKWPE